MIELRSDTLTMPTPAMLEAMMRARAGDDVFGEDTETAELEQACAELFGMEAGMLACSGTMSNQLALRALTSTGDEVIVDRSYHLHYFESASAASLAGVTLNLCITEDGHMEPDHVLDAIESKGRFSPSYAKPVLLWLENSVNSMGGRIYTVDEIAELRAAARDLGLRVYLDGARLLNVCAALDVAPVAFTRHVDALNVCFSKGLGAPFGSILLGSADIVEEARRVRKTYGGGLHQSGYMAAAARFAIENQRGQLAVDNANAAYLRDLLSDAPQLKCWPVETNIVLMDIHSLPLSSDEFAERAAARGVRLLAWGEGRVRAVTSRLVAREDVYHAADVLTAIATEASERVPIHAVRR